MIVQTPYGIGGVLGPGLTKDDKPGYCVVVHRKDCEAEGKVWPYTGSYAFVIVPTVNNAEPNLQNGPEVSI